MYLECLINLLDAERTVHLAWTQPLFYTDQAVDVPTRQADRILGVTHANWAKMKTKPALKLQLEKINIADGQTSMGQNQWVS